MNCPDHEMLSAFFDGEAPEIGEHVTACRACRAFLDDLTAIRASVVAARPELRSAIPIREHSHRRRAPVVAFALLLLILLVVPALFLLRRREETRGAFGNYDAGGRAVIYVKGRP